MPHFFLNIRDGDELTVDEEGSETETLAAAVEEALEAAREILAERLLNNEVLDGKVFEITDEGGNLLKSIPFKDAMHSS